MIPKAERDQDKAILEAATERPWLWWTSNSHRRLRRSDGGPEIAYGTKQRDGADDIVIGERDMRAMETAVNRIEGYIADAEEMEQRIEAVAATCRSLRYGSDCHLVLAAALGILRGEK